jgi:hypothetical protein
VYPNNSLSPAQVNPSVILSFVRNNPGGLEIFVKFPHHPIPSPGQQSLFERFKQAFSTYEPQCFDITPANCKSTMCTLGGGGAEQTYCAKAVYMSWCSETATFLGSNRCNFVLDINLNTNLLQRIQYPYREAQGDLCILAPIQDTLFCSPRL